MQNKARLELADYEAVGTLLLELKAGGLQGKLCLLIECCHFVLWDQQLLCLFCQNRVKFDLDTTSGTLLGNIPGFAVSQIKASSLQPDLQDWGKLHRSLPWFPVNSSLFIYGTP